MAAPASAWSVFDDEEGAPDAPAAEAIDARADAVSTEAPSAATSSAAESLASSSLLRSGTETDVSAGAVVSVACKHTLPCVHTFVRAHSTTTLADLDSQLCLATAEADVTALRRMVSGLNSISEVVNAAGTLLATASAKAGTAPSAAADAASSSAASVDALMVQLADIADSVQTACFSRLEASGSWPHVCWREAFVTAAMAHAAAAGHAGRMQQAMRDVDLALILGAPATELEPLTRVMNMGACAVTAAHRAITRAHLGGAAGAKQLVPLASLDLPTIPAVLGPHHEVDAPDIPASRRILRVAARPLAVKKRRKAGGVDAAELEEHPRLVELRAVVESRPIGGSDFRKRFVKTLTPVVLRGATQYWPAMDAWRELQQLNEAHGHRTIPVEVGQHLSGVWKEQPMLLRDFITNFIAPSITWGFGKRLYRPRPGEATNDASSDAQSVDPNRIAYLAQHGLFEQIPELTEQFDIPLYAGDEVGAVNAWFGTAGTVTRLHFDSYQNLLTQVVGYKYVRLYAPAETPKLYPITKHASVSGTDGSDVTTVQGNISAVDVERIDASLHPLAVDASYMETVLGPGDILYIPRGWWHYVRSMTPSFSVNFWF